MALMSMFYLQQIPNKTDIERLGVDLKQEHAKVLAAQAPLEIKLVRTEKKGSRLGLRIVCSFRESIRSQKRAVDTMLDQIGSSALEHPNWKGRVRFVEVVHAVAPEQHRVVRSSARSAPRSAPPGSRQGAAPGSPLGEARQNR